MRAPASSPARADLGLECQQRLGQPDRIVAMDIVAGIGNSGHPSIRKEGPQFGSRLRVDDVASFAADDEGRQGDVGDAGEDPLRLVLVTGLKAGSNFQVQVPSPRRRALPAAFNSNSAPSAIRRSPRTCSIIASCEGNSDRDSIRLRTRLRPATCIRFATSTSTRPARSGLTAAWAKALSAPSE